MRKILKITFLVLSICAAAAAVLLYTYKGPSTEDAVPFADARDGDTVLLRGSLSYTSKPEDSEYQVSVDSPVLYRKVEMVQWYKNVNDEVYLTKSTESLPDFSHGGVTYDNPEFSYSVGSKLFHGTVSLDGATLSDEVLLQFFGGDNAAFTSSGALTFTDLSLEVAEAHSLDRYGAFFATPGEEWQPGDIVISFEYLSSSDEIEYTIFGVKEGNSVEFGDSGKLWNRNVTDEEINELIKVDYKSEALLVAFIAGILIIVTLVLFFKKEGTSNKRSDIDE